MQLKKRDLPEYTDTLPVAGTTYTFRPYTVKEEKILMMATSSGSPADKVAAIKQIVDNCTNLDSNTLHISDLEWVFIQLRKTSVSSTSDVVYKISEDVCGSKEPDTDCPREIKGMLNLDNARIKSNSDLMSIATPAKGGGWVVKIDDDLSFHMSMTAVTGSDYVLYDLVESVIDGDSVIPKDAYSVDEFKDFIESLPPAVVKPLREFVLAAPYTVADVVARCQKCKKTFTYEASGLINFLV